MRCSRELGAHLSTSGAGSQAVDGSTGRATGEGMATDSPFINLFSAKEEVEEGDQENKYWATLVSTS